MHFSRSRKGLRRVFRAQKRFSQKKPVFPSENRVFSRKNRVFSEKIAFFRVRRLKSKNSHALSAQAFSAFSHLASASVRKR